MAAGLAPPDQTALAVSVLRFLSSLPLPGPVCLYMRVTTMYLTTAINILEDSKKEPKPIPYPTMIHRSVYRLLPRLSCPLALAPG
jgi:hypothetical protein